MANRDIADHMDRLPRDIAAERLHHDIVRLLDEHVPRPSAVQSNFQPASNNLSSMNNSVSSPPSMMNDNFNPGSQNPPQPKPKKRTMKPEQCLGSNGGGIELDKLGPKPPRRPSNRKKKSVDSLLHGGGNRGCGGGAINHAMDSSPLSADSSTMSPPDFHHNIYSVPPNSMAISQPNLSSLAETHPNIQHNYGTLQINKAPPPYEDCFNSKAVSFHNLHFSNYPNNLGGNVHGGSQQQQPHQYLQQNSPFPSPQSVASQFQASSPSTTVSYAGSPPQVTSPSKRPSLPTSPTHMAALRAATQQKLLSASTNTFDYSPSSGAINLNASNNGTPFSYSGGNNMAQYPTPPSQHSDCSSSPQHLNGPDSYPTPSPESPGWSSSPHSTSDWSDGIHSPPGTTQVLYNAHPQIPMQHQHNGSRGPEGIYI